nr:MAG TPA: hypothetical protein [Caudoviricetes sp.]
MSSLSGGVAPLLWAVIARLTPFNFFYFDFYFFIFYSVRCVGLRLYCYWVYLQAYMGFI